MPRRRKRGSLWWLVLVLALSLALSALAMYPQRFGASIILRMAALWGLQLVFLSIVSSTYLRELVLFFGQSFVKIHHATAITGLSCLCMHPLAAAWASRSIAVFVPSIDSWYMFWVYAGRPAFYLLLIAALAARFRRSIVKSWRLLHMLNYVALIFGGVHALLIGTDAQNLATRLVIIAMCAAIVALFAKKHWPKRRNA